MLAELVTRTETLEKHASEQEARATRKSEEAQQMGKENVHTVNELAEVRHLCRVTRAASLPMV